jgi:hypothetical protein
MPRVAPFVLTSLLRTALFASVNADSWDVTVRELNASGLEGLLNHGKRGSDRVGLLGFKPRDGCDAHACSFCKVAHTPPQGRAGHSTLSRCYHVKTLIASINECKDVLDTYTITMLQCFNSATGYDR